VTLTGARGQARLGCAFLLVAGTLLGGTVTGLGLSTGPLTRVEAVAGAEVLTALLLWWLPWDGLSRRWLLLFPAVTTGSVAAVGLLTAGVAPSFVSLLTFSAVAVGVSQPSWTTTAVLPVLVGCWWVSYDVHDAATMVRLPLSVGVWLIVGETLSRLTADHQRESELLRSRADCDALTGLPNRHALEAALPGVEPGSSVLFLDLDHFKAFNDRYGHQAGDRLLQHFASVLRGALRGEDLAARYGGEEFVVLIAANSDPSQLAQRLQRAWRESDGPVTCSIGAATRTGTETARDALERADQALYAAKAAGRDAFVIAPSPAPELRLLNGHGAA
jgi:diguanylate cyclase (GGDEF)-like protein